MTVSKWCLNLCSHSPPNNHSHSNTSSHILIPGHLFQPDRISCLVFEITGDLPNKPTIYWILPLISTSWSWCKVLVGLFLAFSQRDCQHTPRSALNMSWVNQRETAYEPVRKLWGRARADTLIPNKRAICSNCAV